MPLCLFDPSREHESTGYESSRGFFVNGCILDHRGYFNFCNSIYPRCSLSLLGVLDAKQIAASYGHHIVILIIGAFFVAKAIETNQLHKRIALFTIRIIGTSRKRVMLGFMIATGFLSMWTSNNSTTLMMLPIGLAILDREDKAGSDISKFAPGLMLCIAYSASIGGVGTLVGTPQT